MHTLAMIKISVKSRSRREDVGCSSDIGVNDNTLKIIPTQRAVKQKAKFLYPYRYVAIDISNEHATKIPSKWKLWSDVWCCQRMYIPVAVPE